MVYDETKINENKQQNEMRGNKSVVKWLATQQIT